MVLGDLGKRITAAVRKMSSNPVFDEDVLNDMLNEIAMALMAVSAPRRLPLLAMPTAALSLARMPSLCV
jgi:hypothetical protein